MTVRVLRNVEILPGPCHIIGYGSFPATLRACNPALHDSRGSLSLESSPLAFVAGTLAAGLPLAWTPMGLLAVIVGLIGLYGVGSGSKNVTF
jgi:hypothetical protein